MKINTTPSTIGGPAESGRSRPADTQNRSPAAPSGEQVEISSLSSRLQEIGSGANADATPVVDTNRVAEIKQAIAEGRFKVNPERIADGLLNSVREMFKKDRTPT